LATASFSILLEKLVKNEYYNTSLSFYLCGMQSIIRSWREQKILLKRRFPILSDEDFIFEEGKIESMYQRLAQKLRISIPDLDLIFAEIQQS